MKNLILPALLIAAPLSAQSFEIGVFLGQQSYHDSASRPLFAPQNPLISKVDSRTVTALRLGYTLLDFGPASFQVTGGYQPETRATVHTSAPNNTPPFPTDLGDSTLTESYWSVGTMFNFNFPVALGLGLEYRSEKLGGGTTGSFTYNRPWARANVGYVFPMPKVKPFVGLEAALPLSTKSNDTGTSAETAIQAIAPKMQIGIYAGIRF